MSDQVLVTVRYLAGFYYASAGKGFKAKRAINRVSGPAAAQKAAAKVFGPGTQPEAVQLAKQAPGVFRAVLPRNTQRAGGAS